MILIIHSNGRRPARGRALVARSWRSGVTMLYYHYMSYYELLLCTCFTSYYGYYHDICICTYIMIANMIHTNIHYYVHVCIYIYIHTCINC